MALEAEGSSPSIHPKYKYQILISSRDIPIKILGYRQAVRHRTLTPALVGSNPASPVKKVALIYETLAQSVEHLTFNQVVGGSIPPCLTYIK